MQEIIGDIFKLVERSEPPVFNIICVTTNGHVRKDGACVMGRGVALEVARRWPQIPFILGNYLKQNGNHVYLLGQVTFNSKFGIYLISFPVKHHWKEQADLNLIVRSCLELKHYINQYNVQFNILLPKPGCGNGGLDWEDVKAVIEPILPDNIYVVDRS
jgi:hypothetical protein